MNNSVSVIANIRGAVLLISGGGQQRLATLHE